MGAVRLIRVGRAALLVEVDDTLQATAVYDEARTRQVAATDIVPAARTVLFDGVDVDRLAEEITGWPLTDVGRDGRPTVEVPTLYDGEDLADVARAWDMSVGEAVRTHTGTTFTVAFCGFAPGFAYCTGLPQRLAIPRLSSPRNRVPAGSVGLAGEFTGVYPTASPGGWRLIGRTDLTLWDPDRAQPATLAPGTRVRFVEVGR